MIIGKKVFLCGKNIFQNINGRIDFWRKILSLLFIILNLFILYKIYSLRREKSKYLIYTAYIIFGVNVLYGIQWLLKELISNIST